MLLWSVISTVRPPRDWRLLANVKLCVLLSNAVDLCNEKVATGEAERPKIRIQACGAEFNLKCKGEDAKSCYGRHREEVE